MRLHGIALSLACSLSFAVHGATKFDERHVFLAPVPQGGAQLGFDSAVDGDVAVAGAPEEDSTRGAAYVWERFRSGYTFRQRLVASDGLAGDTFGSFVDVDGDTIAVGAPGAQGIGAVYIFARDASGTWTQRQRLVGTRTDGGSAREPGDAFGPVALDGDDLVVGAPGSDFVGIILAENGKHAATPKGAVNDSGAVFHFVRRSGTYTQRDMYFEPGASSLNRFGTSVDIDGNRFVAGAFFGDGAVANSGNAWVFTRSSSTASFAFAAQEIFASDGSFSDQFMVVRIDGGRILVGARGDDTGPVTNHGAAYVFESNGNTFVEVRKLLPQVLENGALFGNSVGLDRRVAVVAAPSGSISHAETFERVGSTWTFQQRLEGRAVTGGSRLAGSVALSDNTIVLGAPGFNEGSNVEAGLVRVFERVEDSGLSRTRRFTTAFPGDLGFGRFDLLGSSVAISDRWLVAGAPGVTRFNSQFLRFETIGAAYVFDRLQPRAPTILTATLADGDRFGKSVAISRDGRTIAVGADDAGPGDRGEVFVYTEPAGGWTGTLSAPAAVVVTVACGTRDGFASSLAIGDDGLILVGSPLNSFGALPSVGAAYVLRPNGAGYDQFCISAANTAVSGQFGAEVALQGAHIYIGAPEESRAYHYEMTPAGPVFRHTLAGSTVSSDGLVAQAKQITGNKFGTGIAAADEVIVVGAPLADTPAGTDAGMAFVYELDGQSIDATAELIGNKFGAGANAGTSVATNGEVIVLGAPLADSEGVVDSGGAYGYEKPISGWTGVLTEDGALDPPEQNASGMFGFDVAATDDAIAIGEPQDDGPTIDGEVADNQGSAFAFDFTELLLSDGFE